MASILLRSLQVLLVPWDPVIRVHPHLSQFLRLPQSQVTQRLFHCRPNLFRLFPLPTPYQGLPFAKGALLLFH
jgi:hypothetical protein